MLLRYFQKAKALNPFNSQVVRLHNLTLQSFSNKEHEVLKRYTEHALQKTEEEGPKKNFASIYLGKGPEAMIERRRLQRAEIELAEKKKASLPQFYESYGDIVIEFELYYEHFTHESQLVDALLSYYGISYRKNDNILFLENFEDSHKEIIKDFKYPLMRVNIALEPTKYLKGRKEIINYLIDNNFIFNPKHISCSATAEQTIQFINDEVRPALDTLFWGPVLTFENMFKSSPKTYRLDRRNYLLLRAIRLNIQRILVMIWKNWGLIRKNREAYKNARETVIKKFEEWEKRIQGKDFHGGQEPDEADFEMYATIKAKDNSRSFRTFLENKCPDRFYRWFIRMQMKCRYDPDRINIIQ